MLCVLVQMISHNKHSNQIKSNIFQCNLCLPKLHLQWQLTHQFSALKNILFITYICWHTGVPTNRPTNVSSQLKYLRTAFTNTLFQSYEFTFHQNPTTTIFKILLDEICSIDTVLRSQTGFFGLWTNSVYFICVKHWMVYVFKTCDWKCSQV